MKVEFQRVLNQPERSFFLFGPRGTGKSTWFKQKRNDHFICIDLLKSENFLTLSRNPSHLEEKLFRCKKGDWIWIDEIQKIPMLLDEVHQLIENKGLKFAMTGSSARKLKRGAANLLAGRAITQQMEGLVYPEFESEWDIRKIVEWGTLPFIWSEKIDEKQYLYDYLFTYIKEEVKEEGLIRRVEPFNRFLEIAGLLNGQKINSSNLSRECGIPRSSVDGYYQILVDTLLVHYLPGFQPMAKVKESVLPKVYWFDCGVAMAAADLLNEEFDSVWAGYSFETYIFHELRVYNSIHKKGRRFFYYQTPSKKEIDFIIETKKGSLGKKSEVICIECKWSKKWKTEWSDEIESLIQSGKVNVKKSFGIYNGKEHFKRGHVEVIPVRDFLKSLWDGEVF